MSYQYLDKVDLALADFLKVIEIEPRHPDGYYNVAAIYLRTQDYDKAWEYYYKAVDHKARIHPNFLKDLQRASGRKK